MNLPLSGSNAQRFFVELISRQQAEIDDSEREAIAASANPADILAAGLQCYKRHGTESSLSITAGILEEMGARAWTTLKDLAHSEQAECELFVHATATCPGVSASERQEALTSLAQNQDINVRRRVLEKMEFDHSSASRAVLMVLARFDDDLKQSVQDLLASV